MGGDYIIDIRFSKQLHGYGGTSRLKRFFYGFERRLSITTGR